MANITKTYTKILAALLAWLGFSSTLSGCMEYGAPVATYKAKGTVVSKTDKSPIPGIRAVFKRYPYDIEEQPCRREPIYADTDSKGVFRLLVKSHHSDLFYIELTDVDGEKNGLFANKVIEADYSNEKFTGGDGNWYRGSAEKDLGIIEMEPEE